MLGELMLRYRKEFLWSLSYQQLGWWGNVILAQEKFDAS